MLVRLRDFAEVNRISERTVQLRIKEHWEELASHIDRRGKQGTWLDDFAQNFLLDCIKLPSQDEVLVPTAREAALLIQLADANKALADAERRAAANAAAAGKVELLEASYASQAAQIAALAAEKGQAEEKASREATAAQEAQKQLAAAQERERALKEYAAAMEAWSAQGWWQRRKMPRPAPPEWLKEG